MAVFGAEMVPACQSLPAGRVAGEDSIDSLEISLDGHLSAENHLRLLLAEARSTDQNLAGITRPGVANSIASVAAA